MESRIRFLSLNIGMKSNLAGLTNILVNHNLYVVFLHEVKLTDDELESKIGRFGYKCKVNINIEDLTKPGTAIVWRSFLEVEEVTTLVTCRAQIAFLKN